MKKQKKVLIIVVFFVIILSSCQVFATNSTEDEIEFSEEYLQYLETTDKQNIIAPMAYDITKSQLKVTNPLKLTRMLGSLIQSRYSLREIIPENMTIKNQMPTNTCWAFASLATLESHFALQDYKNGITTPIVYDFSERHMDYATTREFLNGEVNEYGFNRVPGDVAVSGVAMAYLTNGLGAISEEEMEFETNSDIIDISEIQNKNVITQVNDIITFPSYSATDDKTLIIQQMKEHIMNYGAISTDIYASGMYEGSNVYNTETSALYCNDASMYKVDHTVAIIGWDDNYSVENFVEENRPTSNGAWIIKNSNGTNFGDEGFLYVSYEDVNIYKRLTGIQNAQTEVTYENLYQYDEFGGYIKYKSNGASKVYLATEFDKKTTGKEYLTQVSIHAGEKYTCKVYVNPNGTSKAIEDLQQVQLTTGETETFEAGYHTIEFLNPVKINSDNYVVVLEIEGEQENYVTMMIEFNYGEFYKNNPNAANHDYDNVTIANEKCFIAKEEEFSANQWRVTSNSYETSGGKLPNFDTTIKAFTTSKVLESIEITTPPTTTSYIEGYDFDKTGLVVKGNWANGDVIEITDYAIQDGTELLLGQTSVTISYNGFMTTQQIEVVENTLESIEIKTPPTKTEYWAGDDFDSTAMEIQAVYKDGTKEPIIEYTVQDGQTLKNGQTTVTIEYQGKTTTQAINVKENIVEKIEIIQAPNKVSYIAKQNFNAEGMIVNATYANGTSKEVTDYTIKDGNDLYVGQTTVTIEYEEKTATQEITVAEKSVIGIIVKTMPTKIKYLQNKEELDLTGGTIEISYNDNTAEQISMQLEEITVEGFNNKEVGVQTIILTYQNKITQFNIEIEELPKPENSILDDVQALITGMGAYYYTDENQKEYAILDIEISNIIKSTKNEKMEYYYYLSANPNEEYIADWLKLHTLQETNENMQFEINTLDLENYEELLNANSIYLYVKEVAIRNDMKAEAISKSLSLDIKNINIEEYLNGEKIADVNSNTIIEETPAEEDNTRAPGMIPKAGRNIAMILLILVISVIGRISYLKYKDIKI